MRTPNGGDTRDPDERLHDARMEVEEMKEHREAAMTEQMSDYTYDAADNCYTPVKGCGHCESSAVPATCPKHGKFAKRTMLLRQLKHVARALQRWPASKNLPPFSASSYAGWEKKKREAQND